MKKILIISYSFPPLNNIAARRFSEMIPTLQDEGLEVHVLTTKSEGDLSLNSKIKNIERIGEHPQKSLALINKKKKLSTRFRHQLGFSLRTFDSSLFVAFKQLFNMRLIKHYQEVGIDLIIASFGPASSLWVGHFLARILKIPWIADFRDLGALHQTSFDHKNPISKRLDKSIERHLIKTAIGLTSVSYALALELKKAYRKPVDVIYNGWNDNDEITICHLRSTTENRMVDKYTFYYAGTLYEHQLDSVFILLNALKHSNYKLVARLLGPAKLKEKLLGYSQSNNCSENLLILPPAVNAVILQEQANSFANIVFEDLKHDFDFKKGVLTGKFLRLLIEKPPILAIARDDSEIGEILTQTKKGQLITSSEEVACFIRNVENDCFSRPNRERIKEFSKVEQGKKLAGIVHNLLDNLKK